MPRNRLNLKAFTSRDGFPGHGFSCTGAKRYVTVIDLLCKIVTKTWEMDNGHEKGIIGGKWESKRLISEGAHDV